MHKIFIDGQAGTTGLELQSRLQCRDDMELLEIDHARRKDEGAKREIIASADVVVLCLPDDAARDTVALAQGLGARFLDASTAHRVSPEWVYGLPELGGGRREQIAAAEQVSNPGCYPTGFITLVKPLVDASLLAADVQLTANALSGYSGGGHELIERYERQAMLNPDSLWHARPYGLTLQHKHVPEMTHYAGLARTPIFLPAVGHFHQGMLVQVGLSQPHFSRRITASQVHDTLAEFYAGEPCVRVLPLGDDSELDAGFLDPQAANGTNRIDLFVFGHDEQMALVARLDNLGKGACGAAVQNLNLMLGAGELHGIAL